jgi:hypothetical protein
MCRPKSAYQIKLDLALASPDWRGTLLSIEPAIAATTAALNAPSEHPMEDLLSECR